MAILFDTGFLYAYYNIKDKYHKESNQIYEEILDGKYGSPILVDYIFDELMTLIQARTKSNLIATRIGSAIKEDIEDYLQFLQVSNSDFENAWNYFKDQSNKKFLSFTDCILIAVTKSLEIDILATLDQQFKSWVNVLPIIS